MKLLELEIDKVRGIQNLLVKPNGGSFVIWGPNGSGKSAVVDAIDFLLTGKIQRLTGEGTGNINLSKHGPHIDHKPEETMVRAVVKLRGSGKSIELKRSIGEPRKLICSIDGDKELDNIIVLAEQGTHILSRREILKYITANANKRAEEIQDLLNITEIEETRGTLVKIKNKYVKDLGNIQTAVERAKGQVNATTQKKTFNEAEILEEVNRNRRVLGADAIAELRSANLKINVSAPKVVAKSNGFNITLFDRDVLNLQNALSKENETQMGENDNKLRKIVEKISKNPELMRTLKQLQLIKLGMSMVDETGKCPLCDKEWPSGELLKFLESRIATARIAEEYQGEIGQLTTLMFTNISTITASLKKVIAACKVTGLENDYVILESWHKDLEEFSNTLSSATENYLETGWTSAKVRRFLAPEDILAVLDNVSSAVKVKYPESTPEQNAWDTLTRLEVNLRALESAEADVKMAKLYVKRASLLHDHFLLARDKILGQLYEAIKDRFVDLYRDLHTDDESKFNAKIEPKEAALNLEVDFYGRGTHAPHALHSEGHQDSMGLCLFLALAEHLTKGLIDLVVLDDVVMSVDIGHRRRLCKLLAGNFPDRQFLITTHDKTWAKQLQTEGVVKSEGSIEFYNWCLELGPQVDYEVDLWKHIKDDLDRGDVPSAAHKLRRGCEDYFGQVCDFLQAQVRYKLDGRYELGNFLPAAMRQYRYLLKKAKNAAQSWANQELFEKLRELDSTVSQIYIRCGVERWAVNASIHYNNWANLSKNDFQPVVEAFEDLCKLFVCSTCAGMLHVTTTGLDLENVRCNCGLVSWNLIPKK